MKGTARRWIVLGGIFLFPLLLQAQEGASDRAEYFDLSQLLGMSPAETYEVLGAPAEVLASRTQNEVLQLVHFYADFIYLFWFRNRVWQIRVDSRFKGVFLGLRMGMTRAQVEHLLGPPRYAEEGGWYTYELPVVGYPRRLRLKFNDGRLADLYFFRSDL